MPRKRIIYGNAKLPEAIFQKVNENFYRTTFYDLCNRYLSPWFSWHLERSYAEGKSDLEFVSYCIGNQGFRVFQVT